MRGGAFGVASGLVGLTLAAALALTTSPPRAHAAVDAATPTPASMTPSPSAVGGSTSDRPQASDPGPPIDPFRDREDALALMLGRARVGAGLLPLARSPALDRAAVGHAQDMAARGYMQHEAPDGSTPGTRAAQEGYDTPPGGAWLVVETISAISDEPDGALGWWLSDGLHRRVVLRPTWRELGVAETRAAAQRQDWEPYTPQRAWPPGRTAVVDVRDAAGHELETPAADPTG